MTFKACQQHFRQLADARFVVRVTDVDDLSVTAAVFVFDDAEQRFNTVADIGEATFLFATFNQLNGRTFHQLRISWVIARELPIRAAFRLSGAAPSS